MGNTGSQRFAFILVLLAILAGDVFSAGLPGEYIVNPRWREMFGIHSPVGNPAFMTEENYVSGRGAFAPVLQGEFKLWELGATVPIGLYQSAGFTWLGESDGDVQVGSFDSITGRISLSNETQRNTNSFFVASYAINPWNKLSVGANLTFAYQSNFGSPLMGIGFDLGATYRVIRHPVFGEHILGLSTQNLIAPSMTKDIIPKLRNDGEYSRDLKVSWYGNFWEKRLESSLDLDIRDFMAAGEEFQKSNSAGQLVDATKKAEWGLSWRFGGWLLRMINLYAVLGFDKDVLGYWGLAAGANLPSFNNGRDFQVLYQFQMKTEAVESQAHTFYLRIDAGKHREEIYARKMARLASLSPNELYNRALGLFYKDKFWDAFLVFSQIDVQFPDFFKIDYVQYYMGRCQEELDMREAALRQYTALKSKYMASPIIPSADLGMMRIHYRENRFGDVSNQYIELNKPTVPDSIKGHAYYLMGEAYMNNERYQDAVTVLHLIPQNHPEYAFARHTAAIASWIAGDTDNTLIDLEAAVKAQAKNNQTKEIVNRSYLFLGYIFYERSELGKAVTALRLVSKGSRYYEQALLGLGWSAVQARQFADCITSGQELRNTASLPVLKCEGAIIETYGDMLQKNYDAGLAALDAITSLVQGLKTPPQDSLLQEQEHYKMTRAMYDFFSDDVNKIARLGPSSVAIVTVDSMHAKQQEIKGKLDAFMLFQDKFRKETFFARTNEAVKSDVEYLYAYVRKRASTSKTVKEGQESLDKQKKYDEEIEKLKNEMNTIDNKDQGKKEEKKPEGNK